jgi:large subunit ribosomal protein L22
MATETATTRSSAAATAAAPVIEAHAMARHVRMSPQKVRLVIDLIRGQRAESALLTLKFTQKRASRDVEKVLRSAIANAERKAEDAGATLDVDQLFVSHCFVNEGSRWKRLRPAPMGRAFRYQRRTSHIVVGVAEHHLAAQDRAAEAAAEKESQKGVRGAVKKAREALVGQKRNTRRSKKAK